MTTTVYSVVVGDNDTARLAAYLYSHTERVAELTCGNVTAYLLRTEAHNRGRADFFADYQVSRLESGLYARKACAVSLTHALNALKHFASTEIDHNAVVAGLKRKEADAVRREN